MLTTVNPAVLVELTEAIFTCLHKLLLQHKAAADYGTLNLAATFGMLKVATSLLDNGMSPNPSGKYWPALYYAADAGHDEVVQLLLARGADIKAGDQAIGIMMGALARCNPQTVQAIADKGFSLTAMMDLPQEIMSMSSWNWFQISYSFKKISPLHYAILQGKVDLVKYLLEHGADARSVSPEGLTSLHFAALSNSNREGDGEQLLNVLIDAGCDVNAVSGAYAQEILREDKSKNKVYKVKMTGLTPLHLAMLSPGSREEKVKALVAKGANVNARTKEGAMSVLHLAVISDDQPPLYELLIAKGADVNAKAADGRTPLKLALDVEALDHVASVLREHGGK
jgi:ankyrin repeat protein